MSTLMLILQGIQPEIKTPPPPGAVRTHFLSDLSGADLAIEQNILDVLRKSQRPLYTEEVCEAMPFAAPSHELVDDALLRLLRHGHLVMVRAEGRRRKFTLTSGQASNA